MGLCGVGEGERLIDMNLHGAGGVHHPDFGLSRAPAVGVVPLAALYASSTMPRHLGKVLQPQNRRPALRPDLAVRSTIGAPHFGQGRAFQ